MEDIHPPLIKLPPLLHSRRAHAASAPPNRKAHPLRARRLTADSIPSMAPLPQGGSAVEDSSAVQPKLHTSALWGGKRFSGGEVEHGAAP